MKTIALTFLLFFAFNVFAQKSSLPDSLKKIPSISHITLDDQISAAVVKPFHADSLSECSFLKSKKLVTGFATENNMVLSPLVEKQNGMPVINPGSASRMWNMPVAKPDSTVDYYIKNLPLGSGEDE